MAGWGPILCELMQILCNTTIDIVASYRALYTRKRTYVYKNERTSVRNEIIPSTYTFPNACVT